MAEYVNIVVQSLVISTLFFGGWQIPWVSHEWLAKPEHASAILRILLWLVAIGCAAGGRQAALLAPEEPHAVDDARVARGTRALVPPRVSGRR